jgi:hydrogenase nickel incorporation protein HypA/HybF
LHELGVTQNLLDLALRHANDAQAVHINQLNLVVGQLSSLVDDSIQFYWDIISAGTIAQGATLNFKRISATLRCTACGHGFPLQREDYLCPQCGSDRVIVAGGEEFYLESIDVDLAKEAAAHD